MANAPLSFLLVIVAATGCVSSGKYDQALQDAQKLRAEQAASRAAVKDREATIGTLTGSVTRLQTRNEQLSTELQTAAARASSCNASLDELTAQDQQLRSELVKQGKNVDELLSSKGALASSLAQAKARLEELRKAQAAAEARSSLFRGLALKLRKMIDSGDLAIALRSGRMVLVLPSDVLFDSGKAKVAARGRETLRQVASALGAIKDRRFQVSGHTDSDPIRYSGFESNWALSTARALEVVQVLTEGGMAPASLSAAGYAEFDPVAENDGAEHKAANRRIEIVLQPNIDELVAVPQSN